MNLYLQITFRTFTIWILACLINGVFCATYVSIFIHYYSGLPADILLAFFISLFFSAPGFFVFWIILLVKLSNKIYERALFRVALSSGFALSVTTALIYWLLLEPAQAPGKYMLMLFAIISAVSSIMMHFNHFKKIAKQA